MEVDVKNEGNIILFDGICNMCSGIVQFLIKRDKHSKFKFASLQSTPGQQLLAIASMPLDNFDTFLYFRRGKIYMESTAALLVLKDLGGFYSAFYFFIIIPAFIRNAVYKIIARSRYSIWGRAEQCMIPTPAIKSRFLS